MPETPSGQSAAIGSLRALVTAQVVAHHAVLAYHPFAPAPPQPLAVQPYWWTAFPVVDGQRSMLVALFTGFNDVYFMALMFLLSGFFVWSSLARRGAGGFVRERALKLGLPFVVVALLLAPLAYYPSYLRAEAHPSLGGFARTWLGLGTWPAGPAWFLWVLLAFDLVAAAVFALKPDGATALGRRLSGVIQRPIALFAALTAAALVAYAPLALVFSPLQWTAVGPFSFQSSRLLLYAVYFAAGVVIGAHGLPRAFPAEERRLARRWWLWAIVALVAFAATIPAALAGMAHPTSRLVLLAGALSVVVSCAASSMAALAFALRFLDRSRPALDVLREQAYGVYLVHYPIVSWLQLALLGLAWPAVAKAGTVFAAALALSVAVVAALRRLPAVRRIV